MRSAIASATFTIRHTHFCPHRPFNTPVRAPSAPIISPTQLPRRRLPMVHFSLPTGQFRPLVSTHPGLKFKRRRHQRRHLQRRRLHHQHRSECTLTLAQPTRPSPIFFSTMNATSWFSAQTRADAATHLPSTTWAGPSPAHRSRRGCPRRWIGPPLYYNANGRSELDRRTARFNPEDYVYFSYDARRPQEPGNPLALPGQHRRQRSFRSARRQSVCHELLSIRSTRRFDSSPPTRLAIILSRVFDAIGQLIQQVSLRSESHGLGDQSFRARSRRAGVGNHQCARRSHVDGLQFPKASFGISNEARTVQPKKLAL